MEATHRGVIEPGKTIICGHWHCSFGHAHYEGKGGEFDHDSDFMPYYGDGIIALDACIVVSRKVNCIIIEDSLVVSGGAISERNKKFLHWIAESFEGCVLLSWITRKNCVFQPVEKTGYAASGSRVFGTNREKRWKNQERKCSFHFQLASFFRFMAANLSFTQFVTWAKPLYCV